MREIPWLPDFVDREDAESDDEYLGRLYQLFSEDFMLRAPTVFAPRRIAFSEVVTNGRCETFHHCTTVRASRTNQRIFEPHRSKRLSWLRPVIEAIGDPERVVSWRMRVKNDMRVKIALPDYRYVVIFTESSETMFLVTAYYVIYEKERQKLAKERRTSELPI